MSVWELVPRTYLQRVESDVRKGADNVKIERDFGSHIDRIQLSPRMKMIGSS